MDLKIKNWKKINKWLDIASEISTVAMAIRDKPKITDLIAVGIRSVKIVQRVAETDPQSYFQDWFTLGTTFSSHILEEASDGNCVGTGHTFTGHIYTVEGIEFGILSRENAQAWAYVRHEDLDRASAVLRKIAWKSVMSDHAVISNMKVAADQYFEKDPYPLTKIFKEIQRTVNTYRAADVKRSYLLVGPPGTGKSEGITALVSDLGLRSIRVEFSQNTQFSDLSSALSVFSPDVVILEDLDHVSVGDSVLLHFLEELHNRVEIVLGTSNRINKLSPALIRPGRFDEIISVRTLDYDTVINLTGPVDADVCNLLKDLPIAYITEFATRVRCMDIDALKTAEELKRRYDEHGYFREKYDNLASIRGELVESRR